MRRNIKDQDETNQLNDFQRKVMAEVCDNTSIKFEIGLAPMLRDIGPICITCNASGCAYRGKIYLRPDVHAFKSLTTKTLFHELAHVTAASLKRPHVIAFKSHDYNREEVVAEMTAEILMNFFDLMNFEVFAYIHSYIERYSKDLSELDIEWAKREAQKAANYILKVWIPRRAAEQTGVAA